MRIFVLAVSLAGACCVAASQAQEEEQAPSTPILINKSRSPDGRKEMTVSDTNGQGIATGTVNVRETGTARSLGSFAWAGFGSHPGADAFTVLWRPDSRAFAIEYTVTKGYGECKVYVLSAGRKCREVRLPDFVAQVARQYGYKNTSHGSERPARWLPGNRLVINAANRGWEHELTPGGYVDECYTVTLHLTGAAASPRAAVTNIHPTPRPPDSSTGS